MATKVRNKMLHIFYMIDQLSSDGLSSTVDAGSAGGSAMMSPCAHMPIMCVYTGHPNVCNQVCMHWLHFYWVILCWESAVLKRLTHVVLLNDILNMMLYYTSIQFSLGKKNTYIEILFGLVLKIAANSNMRLHLLTFNLRYSYWTPYNYIWIGLVD